MPFSTERAVGRRCDPSFLLALLSELVPSICATALSYYYYYQCCLTCLNIEIERKQNERFRYALHECASKSKL